MSEYNFIYNPSDNSKHSIFSKTGRNLLKKLIDSYKVGAGYSLDPRLPKIAGMGEIVGYKPCNHEPALPKVLNELLKYNVDVYFCGHEHNFQILKYKKLKIVVNGAGSYSNEVLCYNNNLNVDTLYVSSSNGFTFHDVTRNNFTINFMNTNGKIEYQHEIRK